MNQEKEPARVTKNSSLNGLVSHLRWNAAFPSMVDSLEFSLRSLLADLPSIGAIRCTSDCPESRSGSVKIQVPLSGTQYFSEPEGVLFLVRSFAHPKE